MNDWAEELLPSKLHYTDWNNFDNSVIVVKNERPHAGRGTDFARYKHGIRARAGFAAIYAKGDGAFWRCKS